MNYEESFASSPPIPLPFASSSPPIFFSPISSSNNNISPSPSPSSSSSSSSNSLPAAALVGTGVAGAVIATALVATIATKMGCTFLPPFLSFLSFLFKKVLSTQTCSQIFTICGRKRSRKSSSSRSFDYDRDDSNNGSESISRRSPLSPSTRSRHDHHHRYRDDVTIEVWEELQGTRQRLHDQVNDVGHTLRPTKSNISKFAAAEMRKLEDKHGINIHDTTLVINKNLRESHDQIHTVNHSVEEFEVAIIERSKSNVDRSSSAVALDQMNELRTHQITQRLHQSAETSNDWTDEGDQIDNQLRRSSDGHENVPSTSRPEANKLRIETTAAPPAHFESDRTLVETRRDRLQNPKSKILASATASVSGGVPTEFARNRRRRPDLQMVASDKYGNHNRSRSRDSVHADRSRKIPTRRRPNKRRRLSKVAGVRLSCEVSAHFWKLFVFCKTGTNYGADDKKGVDGTGDSSRRHHGLSDGGDSSPPTPKVPDDRDSSPQQLTVSDGTLEKPFPVHLPSMPNRAMEVPPAFLPIQFYQPSVYPAPPTIVTSRSGVGTAAYSDPSHNIHGHYSSEAAMMGSSMASDANSSAAQSSAAMVQMPEAKIRHHYNTPYLLVPVLNTAGGTYATVAMMAPMPMPMQHHVKISKNTAADSSTHASDTNSMTDDVDDLAEQSATSNHLEKAASKMPTTSAHSSSTDSKKETVQHHEFGTPLYGV